MDKHHLLSAGAATVTTFDKIRARKASDVSSKASDLKLNQITKVLVIFLVVKVLYRKQAHVFACYAFHSFVPL